MKTVSLVLLSLVWLFFSCKGKGMAQSEVLPILGETSRHPVTGELVYYKAPEFSLRSQTGEAFSEQQLHGKIHVVDFFFTTCPTICPKMTSHLREVQQHFEGNDKVGILSYSIDALTDTPEVLENYAMANGIKNEQWKLLTADQTDVFEISKGYKVMAFDDSRGEERTLIHDGTFVLLDAERRIRGYYNGLDPQDTRRLIADMEKLLKGL
ncbi:SCO family protein [Poritiphilus flavus]|uniref:Redoxin family protein n=1 Tax=Poritiphilus flavus TaxID=2697053 RepID=A0A6L9EAD2_9FLAO|nr:SCO family protein [Poritiphilus flavus]NAS11498.1 redoxin family protein [Poritiphilus flavus]